MHNLEFKAELRDPALARIICRAIGAIHAASFEQTDTYYRLAAGRFKKRQVPGEPTEFIFYDRPDRSGPKLSHFTIYSESEALARFGAQPLPESATIHKHREVNPRPGPHPPRRGHHPRPLHRIRSPRQPRPPHPRLPESHHRTPRHLRPGHGRADRRRVCRSDRGRERRKSGARLTMTALHPSIVSWYTLWVKTLSRCIVLLVGMLLAVEPAHPQEHVAQDLDELIRARMHSRQQVEDKLRIEAQMALDKAAKAGLPELVDVIIPSVFTVSTFGADGSLLSQGTGFLLDGSYIITNVHVIEGAHRAFGTATDGAVYSLDDVVAFDSANDIMVLRSKAGFPNTRLRLLPTKDTPRVGERIFVIGTPEGLQGTVTDGVVSAVRDLAGLSRVIQISAPISHGSSGSPVITESGRVVGGLAHLRWTGEVYQRRLASNCSGLR